MHDQSFFCHFLCNRKWAIYYFNITIDNENDDANRVPVPWQPTPTNATPLNMVVSSALLQLYVHELKYRGYDALTFTRRLKNCYLYDDILKEDLGTHGILKKIHKYMSCIYQASLEITYMFKWSVLPVQPSENSSHEAKGLMNKHDPPLFHMFFLSNDFWLFEIRCCNLPTTCILCLLYCIVLLQEVTKCCSIHMGSIYIVHSYCVACTYSKYPVLNSASNLSIKPQFASGIVFFALRFSVIIFILYSVITFYNLLQILYALRGN